MKVRIKRGAPVMQDFSFFRWPGNYENEADTLFDCEPTTSGGGKCTAPGFGAKTPHYGNGAVYISGIRERGKP